jgi:hypothetical protein
VDGTNRLLALLLAAIIAAGFLLFAGPTQAQQIQCNASKSVVITTATDMKRVADSSE